MKRQKKLKLLVIAMTLAAMLGIRTGLQQARNTDAHLMSRAVLLQTPNVAHSGSCSGVQVHAPSGEDYILTAAHCRLLADAQGNMKVTTEDGKSLMRQIIVESPSSDLLLLQGLPNTRGLDVASHSHRGQHVRTFTHGFGLDTYHTEGELISKAEVAFMVPDKEGECETMPKYKKQEVNFGFFSFQVCVMSTTEIASTAQVVPGSSGGMVVTNSGDLVGIVSASREGMMSYFVSLDDIRDFMRSY